jgi:probable HAF family extracellular repeat protein
MVGIGACAGDRPTGPDASIIAAKGGGGGGPKVNAAEPNNAPQDTTLDVRVIGSGFEDGSAVKLLLAGQSTPKIVTNSTRFVDGNNLIANITIAIDAEIALYDIEVTPPRGRPGVGSELFSVKEKGKPADDGPQFNITSTELGTLEGRSSSAASGIVSAPDGLTIRVVGGSSGGNGAFYWTPGGGMVELTGPAEPNASIGGTRAVDISPGGHIVGERIVIRGDPDLNGGQALFWSSNVAEAIVLPTQARSFFATAVNNNGQVVGQSFDHPDDPDGPHQHAMLWTVDAAGTVTTRDLHEETLGALGFVTSQAEGINDRGQVVGWAHDGFRERAFLWDNGVVTLLDDAVDPSLLSFAYAINNADPVQIIGGAHDQSGGQRRGLLWTIPSDGVQTEELPPLTGFDWAWASDINDAGEAVGSSRPTSNSEDHVTLWTFDPETGARIAVDLGQGWARAIDNSASLVGLTRVVGSTTIESGKGRKKTMNTIAIMWGVEPIL